MSEDIKVPMSSYTVKIPMDVYHGIGRLLQDKELRGKGRQTMKSKLTEYIVDGYNREKK